MTDTSPQRLPNCSSLFVRSNVRSLEWSQLFKSVNSAIRWAFLFQNNAKNLSSSYMMDLDFWNCFGKESLSEEIRLVA